MRYYSLPWAEWKADQLAAEHQQVILSAERFITPVDKYDIADFARDHPAKFLELIEYLPPRDAEILLCYGVLQKRPTDLSILFGKAGHRAEEDLHKAAHKLAGLIEFGPLPEIEKIARILGSVGIQHFGAHSLAACMWQYARCRDFGEMARLIGRRGLRKEMLRTFKKFHVSEGREEGLLAGWILWLIDGSDPKGKGWCKRRRCGRQYKLGPTTFHTFGEKAEHLSRRAREKGGRREQVSTTRVRRKLKFLLRGTNA